MVWAFVTLLAMLGLVTAAGMAGRRARQCGGFHQAVVESVVNVVNGGGVVVREALQGVVGVLYRLA